jgi:PmbA protein
VGAPTVSAGNLMIAAGEQTPAEIIGSVKQGLYLTEMIGQGVNIVTGDYSRSAGGLWIENGELSFPVQGVTVAGNLKEMLRDVEMVGTDLVFRSGTAAPTFKMAKLVVSGL